MAIVLLVTCGGSTEPNIEATGEQVLPASTPTATLTPTPTPTSTPTAILTPTPKPLVKSPPFHGTLFVSSEILVSTDPTAFYELEKIKDSPRTMYDRRKGWITLTPHLFKARFLDGLTIEVQVNPEFKNAVIAEEVALKYLKVIGQLPTLLRKDVETIWIHKGDELFGGGNNNLLIHHDQGLIYETQGLLEEVFLHEAVHTSLDNDHLSTPGWLQAQQDDGQFISDYAKESPSSEDISESFPMYFALRYKASRIETHILKLIENTIPNRIEYFDKSIPDLTQMLDSSETPTSESTNTPTASPQPFISKPGKMTVARTYSGADECLAISSENAFCVEILAFDVDAESLEKIHEGLDWATRLFPVSQNELTTQIGIQDYIGISLWNSETSDIEMLARDMCLFQMDLGDARDDDCMETMKDRIRSQKAGARARSSSIDSHSGFSILAAPSMWSRYADDDLNSHRVDFRKILSHEYFHSYQQAHRLRVRTGSKNHKPNSPNWLIEGSAEFAANVVAAKAGWIDWNHALKWRMEMIQAALRDYPELSISMNKTVQQRTEEVEKKYWHVVTYSMGFWATAFAASISSNDAILKDYWDDLEKYGWEKSFERNVGYPVHDFYPLFETFLLDHADDENFDWLSSFSLIDHLPFDGH